MEQGVICGEDDHMLMHCVTHINKQFDSIRLCCLEMFSLTTVNMEHICISNVLHIFRTKLLSKENPRSNNNNSPRILHLKAALCIHDSNQSFTTTSGENTLTNRILVQCIKCPLLVGAEKVRVMNECGVVIIRTFGGYTIYTESVMFSTI